MPRKRFKIDVSAYDGSQANVVKMSFQQRFPITTNRLRVKTLIPDVEALRDKRAQNGLTRSFIRYQKTTTIEAVKFLRTYETWMTTTLLNNATGLNDLDGSHLMTRLQIDPVGVKDPDYTDTLLWTANKVVQVADPATAAATTNRKTGLLCCVRGSR